jgi:uncharacterized protein (DUF488 family)
MQKFENTIFTIGYSVFEINEFIEILKKFEINVIADVRSKPFSRYKPEYNRNSLVDSLKRENIKYVFLGEECGARISNPECYINGKANYSLIANTDSFKNCINILKEEMKKHIICLMCAEKDPVNCHRTILICRNLKDNLINIKHILSDGTLEDHSQLEIRMMRLNKIQESDLFMSNEELLQMAYENQGDKIAYSESSED